MQIEFCAAWVDQDLAGVVVEKEGDVHALGRHHYPLIVPAAAFPLLHYAAIVITGTPGDGCNHIVRTDGEATQLDHAERCAPNFRNWSVEDEVTALEKAEALKE